MKLSFDLRVVWLIACVAFGVACTRESKCADCGEGGGGGGAGTGGEGGAACTQTVGVLEGDVYEISGKYPHATIVLHEEGVTDPLYGEADDTGHYKIELPSGSWTVGAETASNCVTEMDMPAEIIACETVLLDLHADLCFDGM